MKNDRIATAIKQIGLSDKESALYIAALTLGESSLSELSRESNLKWTITYNLAKNLVIKGYLSSVSKGKRARYSAVHPRRLLQVAELHKSHIQDLLPELVALHHGAIKRPRAQLYEGKDGMRQAYDEIYNGIQAKNELLWISDIAALESAFPSMLAEYIRKVREVKNPAIRELLVPNEAGLVYQRSMLTKGANASEVRLLPSQIQIESYDMALIGSKVYQFVLGQNLFVSVLESDTIADMHREIFNYLWSVSK